jgi:chemotaxis protein CheD
MIAGRSHAVDFDRGEVKNVHQGDCLVGEDPSLTFSTVLGSCVAACVRDAATGVGGMNHFLLASPSDVARDRYGESARYGAFAMEQLINSVLTRGSGRKSLLEFKIFGGGMVSAALSDIGAKNIAFVHQFLEDEGYAVLAEDVGGSFARRVMFKPNSGRAFVKRLDSNMAASVASEELALARRNRPLRTGTGEIELF